MKDSTKRILLIGGSLLVLGGVAYYFFVYRPKHPKGNEGTSDELPPEDALQDESFGTTATSSIQVPTELNTPEKIKAFQDWMDTIGPWVKGSDGKYKLLNKGAGYGLFGPSTSAAWNYYKSQYLTPIDVVVIDADKDLKTAIDYLVSTWGGDKNAFRKRLMTEKRDFVIKWAGFVNKFKAGQLPKNAFEYAGRVYDIAYGKQRISINPIGKTAKAWKDTTLRQTPSASALKTSVYKGSDFGKVSDYRWNLSENLMFLYVPNNGISSKNKWTYSGNVSF